MKNLVKSTAKVVKKNKSVSATYVTKGVRKLSSGTYNVRKMINGKEISKTFKLRRDAVAYYKSLTK